MAAVAFFDFDNTLLSVNSAWLWVRRELRLGHVTRWQAIQAALWMVRYQLGFVSLDAALKRVIGALHGVEVGPLGTGRTGSSWVAVKGTTSSSAGGASAARRRRAKTSFGTASLSPGMGSPPSAT